MHLVLQRSRSRLAMLTGAGFFLGSISAGNVCAVVSQAEYDAAILAARNGQAAQTIETLRGWLAADSQNKRIVFDLAALLNGAGDYKGALQFAEPILQHESPLYAVKAIAHAARMAGRWEQAEAAYRMLIVRVPEDAEAHAGMVYVFLAKERTQEALDYALAHLPPLGRVRRTDVPLMVALAETYEQRKDWLLAAAAFQEVLRFEPHFRFAQRGRVFALGKAGVAYLAKRLADAHPDAFSEDEKFRLTHDTIANTIRFGEAHSAFDDKVSGFATTDVALAENAQLTQRFGERHVALFDRLVALRDRARNEDAVKLYESLRDAKIEMPVFARIAAADAYLALRRPQSARDLYVAALREAKALGTSEMLNAQVALIYAYVEAEQHDEAVDLSDALVRNISRPIYAGIRGMDAPNPDYARAKLMRAQVDLYSDRLARCEEQLRDILSRAPFNSEARAVWASLQASREHPRQALDEFMRLLVDDPKSFDAALGRAEVLLSLSEFAKAKAALPALKAEYPHRGGVGELERRLDIHDSAYFRVDVATGVGTQALGADSQVDAVLYSAPLDKSLGERYRVFGHAAYIKGSVAGVSESRTRVGAGADFRGRDFSAEAEVTRNVGTNSAGGVALAMTWELSDRWRTRVALDTNTMDVPLAAVRDGVRGTSLKLALTWTLNESRQAGFEATGMRYSDGNDRNAMRVWWLERWISGPRFKMETLLSFAASTNSLGGRSYFNPERDNELALTVRGEWLTWRRYLRNFKQRASLTMGQYRQAGFGTGMVGDLHYEHEWSRDEVLGVQYGIGRSFHPYDGNREYRSYVYLNVFGRIK
ncbi:MAG: poly-beta-1,6 N-acetyl-D-glucosamine export porin PgaA [Burkholderiales bacterium]|nr:poly-beta-1,6 N-acetyl-D-glucosamine export porin PgaA [Burkholderiales bacterium]